MGKKLLNPLEDPPTASSSKDDELETSSGESEEEQISDPSSQETDPSGEDEVEETKEVVSLGGDLEESSWFEKSFLVRFIASLGVDECSVKRKWSKVPVESKKRMEEKFKLLQAEELELLVLKADFLNEVTTAIYESIK